MYFSVSDLNGDSSFCHFSCAGFQMSPGFSCWCEHSSLSLSHQGKYCMAGENLLRYQIGNSNLILIFSLSPYQSYSLFLTLVFVLIWVEVFLPLLAQLAGLASFPRLGLQSESDLKCWALSQLSCPALLLKGTKRSFQDLGCRHCMALCLSVTLDRCYIKRTEGHWWNDVRRGSVKQVRRLEEVKKRERAISPAIFFFCNILLPHPLYHYRGDCS